LDLRRSLGSAGKDRSTAGDGSTDEWRSYVDHQVDDAKPARRRHSTATER